MWRFCGAVGERSPESGPRLRPHCPPCAYIGNRCAFCAKSKAEQRRGGLLPWPGQAVESRMEGAETLAAKKQPRALWPSPQAPFLQTQDRGVVPEVAYCAGNSTCASLGEIHSPTRHYCTGDRKSVV